MNSVLPNWKLTFCIIRNWKGPGKQSRYRIFMFLCFCAVLTCQAQAVQPAFKVVPLGVLGGGDESNLSAYMVAPANSEDYICLDAGTLRFGIGLAVDHKILFGQPLDILRRQIKGYVISHPHLDHVAGLILNSPDDTSKNIYGLSFCLDVLKQDYFTWKGWANFADQGDKPVLNKYHYRLLEPNKEIALENTGMFVQAFLLSHGNPYQSTAFLIRHQNSYLLYLGDTGSDPIEKSIDLALLWQHIGTLVKTKQLKAIFIETSFPDEQPSGQLFGHLTPALLQNEMIALSKFSSTKALFNFPIVITHIKPVTPGARETIKKELLNQNTLHLQFIFAEQASPLTF
jgi:cAMP phosphodiesterase